MSQSRGLAPAGVDLDEGLKDLIQIDLLRFTTIHPRQVVRASKRRVSGRGSATLGRRREEPISQGQGRELNQSGRDVARQDPRETLRCEGA